MITPDDSFRCVAVVPDIRGHRRCRFMASMGRLCGIHYNAEVDSGPIPKVGENGSVPAQEFLAELTELRAYRDRTEAALLLICNGITLNAMCGGPLGQLTSILRDAGLWRDGDA